MIAALIAILGGVSIMWVTIYPLGKNAVRENQVPGWKAWREEFSFSIQFYNPIAIFRELAFGWDRWDETLFRLIMLWFILSGVTIGSFLAGWGVWLLTHL